MRAHKNEALYEDTYNFAPITRTGNRAVSPDLKAPHYGTRYVD